MSRQSKNEFVESMRQDLGRAAGVLFVNYTGLTVAEADRLRRKFMEAEVGYRVVKNTLMARALADTPYADAVKCLRGTPTGVVLGWADPVTPAKVTYDFAKECQHILVKGAIVEQRAIGPNEAEALSKMPSRTELQGMVVSQAQGPGQKLAGQLKSQAGRLVGAIEALVARHEA